MKICVFGAGAIGGYMGVKLAQAGAEVSLVARGPHLAAMQENGRYGVSMLQRGLHLAGFSPISGIAGEIDMPASNSASSDDGSTE